MWKEKDLRLGLGDNSVKDLPYKRVYVWFQNPQQHPGLAACILTPVLDG